MLKTVQRTIVIIITIITIVVFVVIFDDDTYYLVYLSSEHLFQVYTKYDGLLLQSVTAFLLQSVVLLQSEIVITKCDNFITTNSMANLGGWSKSVACKTAPLQLDSIFAQKDLPLGSPICFIRNARNPNITGNWTASSVLKYNCSSQFLSNTV